MYQLNLKHVAEVLKNKNMKNNKKRYIIFREDNIREYHPVKLEDKHDADDLYKLVVDTSKAMWRKEDIVTTVMLYDIFENEILRKEIIGIKGY